MKTISDISFLQELSGIPGIDKADTDGDGFIDVNELVAVVTHQKEQKATNMILKYMLFGLFLTLLITIGAVTGLTYFVVSTLKDTKVDSSNGQQPVLTSKSGAAIATDQLLYRNQLEASLFYASMEDLIKIEQLAWDQGTQNNTLQSFFKISGFVRTVRLVMGSIRSTNNHPHTSPRVQNTELRFFTDAGEIVMTPKGSISIEPPAWCASQFYLKTLDNNTNTSYSGTRRSLVSTDIESSDHPLHNGLLTGFSVSPDLETHQGRHLNYFFTPFTTFIKAVFQPSVFTSSFNSAAAAQKAASDVAAGKGADALLQAVDDAAARRAIADSFLKAADIAAVMAANDAAAKRGTGASAAADIAAADALTRRAAAESDLEVADLIYQQAVAAQKAAADAAAQRAAAAGKAAADAAAQRAAADATAGKAAADAAARNAAAAAAQKAAHAQKVINDATIKYGSTPLVSAVVVQDAATIEALLAAGYKNLEETAGYIYNGRTSLIMVAKYYGYENIVRALLAAGANKDAQDNVRSAL